MNPVNVLGMHTLEQLLALGESEEGKDQLWDILAKLCGWKVLRTGWGTTPEILTGVHTCAPVPNYPNDLNACHEVEVGLIDHPTDKRGSSRADDFAVVRYSHYLREVVGIKLRREEVLSDMKKPDGERLVLFTHVFPSPWSYFEFVHASALQRTIALILTLQKA